MTKAIPAVLLAALALLPLALSPSAGAAGGSCSAEDVRALGLRLDARRVPVLDGWVLSADYDRELRRVCALVPARWRWAERSFDRATDVVDRLYPGHGSWASRCAGSEGGHGEWVWNGPNGGIPLRVSPTRPAGSSGAGGWLQFKSGTFWSVIDGALARARSRGVHVPAFARSWYSAVGQAFAGSEMLFDGRRGEWRGSTC